MITHMKKSHRKTRVEIGTGSKNPTLGGVVSHSTSGEYSATDQAIFTKLGVLVENGVPDV